MPFWDGTLYVSYSDYQNVAQWNTGTTYTCGQLVRPLFNYNGANRLPPGQERVFVCYLSTGGTGKSASVGTGPAGFPNAARGAQVITDGNPTGGVLWQEVTATAPVCGDYRSAPAWNDMRGRVILLGQIIMSNDRSKVLLCTTAGTSGTGAEPSWAAYTTAGATTTDGGVKWTTIGDNGAHMFGFMAAAGPRIGSFIVANWFTNSVGGYNVWIPDNHNEVGVSGTLSVSPNGNATTNNPNRMMCFDHTIGATALPPSGSNLRRGATITVQGNSATITINGQTAYWYGIRFICGSGSTGTTSSPAVQLQPNNGSVHTFENCELGFNVPQTSAGGNILLQPGSGQSCALKLLNTQIASPNSYGNWAINLLNIMATWQNTTGVGYPLLVGNTGGVSGSSLVADINSSSHDFVLEGYDLSAITSALVGNLAAGNNARHLFKDCRLATGTTGYTGYATFPPGYDGHVRLIGCDPSGGTGYYKQFGYEMMGLESTETSVTRVGGATDPHQQLTSRKVTTTTNTSWPWPYKMWPMMVWNEKVNQTVNVNVYGTINQNNPPSNNEIWIECEYFGTTGTTQGIVASTGVANILFGGMSGVTGPTGATGGFLYATGSTGATGYATDSSTWNGGGSSAGWAPFVMKATLDGARNGPVPILPGPITVKVKVAGNQQALPTTYYIDPTIVLS